MMEEEEEEEAEEEDDKDATWNDAELCNSLVTLGVGLPWKEEEFTTRTCSS